MYLVRLPDDQPIQWLFVDSDPSLDGCPLEVERHVEFIDEAAAEAAGLIDDGNSPIAFGRSIAKPSVYKRFIRSAEYDGADLEVLPGKAITLSSWSVYSTVCRVPNSVILGGWSMSSKRASEPNAQ
jgi:hypothetical protein